MQTTLKSKVPTSPADSSVVDALLERMSLPEKIGQMTQVEKGSIQVDDVAQFFIGSVLSGGGGNPDSNTPSAWAQMVHGFQEAALKTRLAIPLLYGVDAVHGHSNVRGAVLFPHNIGLGASRDADLVQHIARITAQELIATGVHWDFAPAVSVPQDIRWGRTYEGYSQNTDIVTKMGAAYLRGLQDGEPRVLASVKHFVGDGATTWGTTKTYEWLTGNYQAPGSTYSIDQGDAQVDEATLRKLHLHPYAAAIEAGTLNIMISFSSWQGVKMHSHKYLLTDVLKGEMGFSGFLVSDWMAVSQLDRDYGTSVISAINAGIDMVMVPYDYRRFIDALTAAVQSGSVSEARIDDAVRRILRAKFWLGLFDRPYGQDELLTEIGSDAHRKVAREAVQKTLVLLKNDEQLLPLPKDAQILVAGRGADDIGMQCGGWSISWQGEHGATTKGTTIFEGIRHTLQDSAEIAYDMDGKFEGDTENVIGIVVVGESPYAEGMGDNATLTLSDDDLALVNRMRQKCEKLVVILISGRPLIVTDTITQADAFVAAWLPGTEAQGIADVLFGDVPFTGKLSYAWPRTLDDVPVSEKMNPLFPLGHGITTKT